MAKLKVEYVLFQVTLTGKKVKLPTKIGSIAAKEGCFLAPLVFKTWKEAKASPLDRSRMIPQVVGNGRYPCFMYDCRFDEYDNHRGYINMIKAEQNREKRDREAREAAGFSADASIEEMLEEGHEFGGDYDATSSEAITNIFYEEFSEHLDTIDPDMKEINNLNDAGYNAREIAESLSKNQWTVTDKIKRIKAERKKFYIS